MDPQAQQQFINNWVKSYQSGAQQPTAQLQETQSAAAAAAASAGLQSTETQTAAVKAQQAQALQDLGKDLSGGMTLDTALKTYTARGMAPDDIFSQYLAASPYGMPNENPQQLQQKGITAKALGDIGIPGSFMDKYNTRNAISGLRTLEDSFNKVSAISKLPFLGGNTASGRAYEAARTIFGNHLSSLIPGASGAQATGQSLLDTIPNVGHIGQLDPASSSQQFKAVEDQLLQTKGYSPKDLGLTPHPVIPQTSKDGVGLIKSLLGAALPTAGAIGGGIGGGLLGAAIPGADLTGVPEVAGAVGGASAGGAAGQTLTDYLTGKKPGADVAVTGALSGVGEGVGAGLGAILGKVGGALASKVPNTVFDKVVNASPDYTTDIAALKNTANKYGLMGGSTADGLKQMPKVMSDIGTKIQTGLSQIKTPVDISIVNKNILDDFSKNTNAFENTKDFENAQKYITDRLYSATGNDNPLSSILNSKGAQTAKAGAQTTYSALYDLKSQVAKDLKPVFKAQANPALGTNFTPKQEANLSLWNGLKTQIDKADPNIRVLNDDQHNMFDIAKGFVKDATAQKGGSGVVGDIFDTLAGNMLGGPGGAIATFIGGKVLQSEGGRAALSKILQGGATKQIPRMLGAFLGGGSGAILGQ